VIGLFTARTFVRLAVVIKRVIINRAYEAEDLCRRPVNSVSAIGQN